MSKRMVDYKVEDGKIVSIDGYELAGGGDYEIKELVVTENGVYDVAGEAYNPVRVNVPQTAQSGTLKALLDTTQSSSYLFNAYTGTSVDGLITRSDTSNVTNMLGMFSSATNLKTIPELDTSHVTNMSYMFYRCSELTTIPALDASNVTDTGSMFGYNRKLTSIGLYGFTRTIDISSAPLGHDAIVALLNQAGTAYNSNQKIEMGSSKLALLSDEEKAIATNKGWTLA